MNPNAPTLIDFCREKMKPRTMKHYQPWTLLALLHRGGEADWDWLALQYSHYEKVAGMTGGALAPKQRLRGAIRTVLQDTHQVVQIAGSVVRISSEYGESDVEEIKQICRAMLHGYRLPPPKFVSGGLPSLGKKR